jgi:hypothetical protein
MNHVQHFPVIFLIHPIQFLRQGDELIMLLIILGRDRDVDRDNREHDDGWILMIRGRERERE